MYVCVHQKNQDQEIDSCETKLKLMALLKQKRKEKKSTNKKL